MDKPPLQDADAPVFMRKNASRILLLLLLLFIMVPVVILVWSDRPSATTKNELPPDPLPRESSSSLESRELAFNASPTVAEAISLSNAFASVSSYAACERVARAGLRLDSLNTVLLNNLGFAQIELRQLGEAVKTLEKAIALKPDFTLAANNLKWCRDEINKAMNAINKKLAGGNSSDGNFQISLGLAWFEVGEYEKSNDCYRKAMKLMPADPRPLNNLGLNLMFSGQIQEAVLCFQRAAELNPSEQLYKNNLNWALKEAEKP